MEEKRYLRDEIIELRKEFTENQNEIDKLNSRQTELASRIEKIEFILGITDKSKSKINSVSTPNLDNGIMPISSTSSQVFKMGNLSINPINNGIHFQNGKLNLNLNTGDYGQLLFNNSYGEFHFNVNRTGISGSNNAHWGVAFGSYNVPFAVTKGFFINPNKENTLLSVDKDGIVYATEFRKISELR